MYRRRVPRPDGNYDKWRLLSVLREPMRCRSRRRDLALCAGNALSARQGVPLWRPCRHVHARAAAAGERWRACQLAKRRSLNADSVNDRLRGTPESACCRSQLPPPCPSDGSVMRLERTVAQLCAPRSVGRRHPTRNARTRPVRWRSGRPRRAQGQSSRRNPQIHD